LREARSIPKQSQPRAHRLFFGSSVPYRYLAACYAHVGRLAEAREIITRLRSISPVVIPDASFLRNAEHRELLLSGLRLAVAEI
jgi:hypothetical protein